MLARGDDFADALAAGPLASAIEAPVLLTAGAELPDVTAGGLDALGAEAVTILGGTAAVSEAVEATLDAAGHAVDRIAGADRYETAAEITAALVDLDGVGEVFGVPMALLASGADFPDGVLASWAGAAGSPSLPVLLTKPDRLLCNGRRRPQRRRCRARVVGGEAAVSASVTEAVEAEGFDVVRIAGDTRHTTAVAVADEVGRWFLDEISIEEVYLARDDDFPDAATAGPAVARLGRVLLLSDPDAEPYRGILAERACFSPGVDRVVAVGARWRSPPLNSTRSRTWPAPADRARRQARRRRRCRRGGCGGGAGCLRP